MRVRVVEGRCTGHARCGAVAPEIFTLNDDGYLELPETAVAAGQEALARRGARACPERAIEVTDDTGAAV